jgi:Xaa-Pro aminopeptidase
MTVDVDRARAARLMAEAGLDAIVAAKPETFAYLTGASPGVPALFRRAGATLAILPADPNAPLAVIATDLFAPMIRRASGIDDVRAHLDWIETADFRPYLPTAETAAALAARAHAGRPEGFARPATFAAAAAFRQLGTVLAERGLADGRIGLDLDFWPVADHRLLGEILPHVAFADGSAVLDRLKAVKSPREIERLRRGGVLAEAGVRAALAEVRIGARRAEIAAAWSAGVDAAAAEIGARELTGRWEYIAFGPDPWSGGDRLAAGDVIKFDVGCLMAGASSDAARTFTMAPARPRTREIHGALLAGFEAGLAVLKPGRMLADVHREATRAIRAAGFERFSRGHFGHGLGTDTFGEVWPFIAAESDAVIEPGMVLAFETPFYVDGEGGFIIEDQFEIGVDGATPVWSLPRGLVELG